MIALRKDFTSWNSYEMKVVLLEKLKFLNSIFLKVYEFKLLIHQFLKAIYKLTYVKTIHQAMMRVYRH